MRLPARRFVASRLPRGVYRTLAATLPAAVALALHTVPAQAATLVVNSTGHGTRTDCGSSSGTAFPTIAAGYAAAAAGDTIFVCPGTYPEELTIAKAITLQGAQAGVGAPGRSGPETIMDAPDGDLLITAPGVTVDGFTFEGQTHAAAQKGAVVAIAGDTTIVNDIFHDNVGDSVAIDGSTGTGPAADIVISRNAADSGISLAAASNVVVSGNQVTEPAAPGDGLRLLGADQDIVVTGNWLVGGVNGVLVQNGLSTPNSGVSVTGNCIAANTRSGLTVAAGSSTGPVQASADWWGSANGPSGTGPGWGDAWIDPDAAISAGAFLTSPLAAPCPQLPSMSIASPPPIRRNRSGTSPLAFTIRLSAPYYTRTQVRWSTMAGTAKAGADFVAADGTVVIPPGKPTATVTVQIVGSTASQGTRRFTVVLSSPVNATVAAGTATATIRDSTLPPATGPGSPTVVPVGGVATGGVAGPSSTDRTSLWGGLTALGAAVALLAAAARLRGASTRRVVPVAATGCMALIAATALLLAGGRGVTAPAQAIPSQPPAPHSATGGPSSAAPASRPPRARPRRQTQQTAVPAGSAPPAPASSGMRVQIPAVGVDAKVVSLGLNSDSTLQVPSTPSDAGWWSGGTHPGEVGPAVIVGHVNWDGQEGVFGRLNELRRGQRVLVTEASGTVDRYVVTGSAVYPKARFPTNRVYGMIGYAGLRLITCTGAFDGSTGHYVDNLIVFARMTGHSKAAA